MLNLSRFLLLSCAALFGGLLFNSATGAPIQTATSRLSVNSADAASLRVTYQTPESTLAPEFTVEDDNPTGAITLSLPNRPVIPVITRTLLIPPHGGVRLADLKVESREERNLRSLASVAAPDDIRDALQVGDDGFWPASAVMIGEPAILRNYRLVTVTLFPVQFNQATGAIRLNSNFDFQLAFDGPEINPLLNPNITPSRYVDRIIRNLVDNPPARDLGRDDADIGGYLYIVARADGVDAVLDTLIEWRRSQGYRVTVAHVDQDAPQNVVKDIIEQLYESEGSVEFVTLVGDASGGDFDISAASGDGDYLYSLMGNDPLPDLAIGRLSARTNQQLQTIVNKIVSYEANPIMNNPAWQLHGGVVAGSSVNGISEVFVAKYVRKELLALGFTDVRHWYWPEDGNVQGDQEYLSDWFRWGMSVLHYRAFHLMNNLSTDVIRNLPNRNGPWPAVLAISCETGNFTPDIDGHTEAFLRAAGGGVGAIGTATQETNVKYNNLMAGGVWKGIYKDSLFAFGWGLNMGKYELWRAFAGLDAVYLNFLDWNNLMGDAGNEVWTGAIRNFDAEYLNTLPLGGSLYPVVVTDLETGDPAADAVVCLYQRDGTSVRARTNADGRADINIAPDAFNAGQIKLTITSHNYKPFRANVAVSRQASFVGYLDHSLANGDDGDQLPNPGEELTYRIVIRNSGTDAVNGPMNVTLTSASDWAEVTGDPVRLENDLQPDQTAEADFTIHIGEQTLDQTTLPFVVSIATGNSSWQSSFELTVAAPVIRVVNAQFAGGDLIPDATRDLTLRLSNVGHKALPAFSVVLSASDERLSIDQNRGAFDAVDVGDEIAQHGQAFRVRAHMGIVPGEKFTLYAEHDGIPLTSASFIVTVGRPVETDPFGPDAFGYYCFDSGDTAWEMAPEYDWVEIDSNVEGFQFRGTRLDLADTGDNQDVSVAVDLPFEFKYYDEDFDRLTICSNGWAAFGDQAELADFRNSHIGQALGPNAQLAVWWDNLITTQESSILTYYDERSGRFVVEWSRMRRLIQFGQGALETFQLILHNQNSLPTADGSGVITFQYLDVTNQAVPAHNDVPYCTIGISNLDDSGGLEYTYYGQYAPGARQVSGGLAIRFANALSVRTGYVRGRVTELTSGRAIPNALVRSNRRFESHTDADGRYSMEMAIGEGYVLTASAFGCNNLIAPAFDLAENETLMVNFALRKPAFAASRDSISAELSVNQSQQFDMTLANQGDGSLEWRTTKSFGNDESDLGQRKRSYPFARNVHDLDLLGIAYGGDRCFVSGDNGNEPQLIYVFDERGSSLGSFPQPGNAPGAIPDLAYDGQLIWGSGERMVYGFNSQGEVQHQFLGPFATNKCIAWDDQRSLLWITSQRTAFYGVDNQGHAFRTLRNHQFNITGLGFWSNDPDGYQLYVLDNPGRDTARVYKIDVETDDVRLVGDLRPPEGGQVGGMEITSDFLNYDWTMAVLINDQINARTGDRADFYQLGYYTGWLSLSADSGEVLAGRDQRLVLTLNTTNMDPDVYRATITFSHNAADDALILPVTLTVFDLSAPDHPDAAAPKEFAIESVWPSPFNSAFTLSYHLPTSSTVKLSLLDLAGREIDRLEEGFKTAGQHSIQIDGGRLASGVYLVRIESGGATRTAKVTMIR